MNVAGIFTVLCFLYFVSDGSCTILALSGYVVSNPAVRSFLIRNGLGTLVTRKAERLYESSNFRYASDQGTDIREAKMDTHDILVINPGNQNKDSAAVNKIEDRNGLHIQSENDTQADDRVYSERLFSVLSEMDKNSCVFRLLCEIGTDPKPFGMVGIKINHYIKSVPPVTWNSATFPYLESFQAGLESNKEICNQHYGSCPYNLNRVMKLLWILQSP